MNIISAGKREKNHQILAVIRECKWCSKQILVSLGYRNYCNETCYRSFRSNLRLNGKEGIDFVKCPICTQKIKQITTKHAKMHGFQNPTDMASKLNLDQKTFTCETKRQATIGSKNGAFNHRGKYSKWSKNFIKGYDENWVKNQSDKNSDFMKNGGRKTNKFILDYWIEKCSGDADKAKEEYIKSQTRDLDWFVKKYGEEEGLTRHAAKTEKWLNTLNQKSVEEKNEINRKKVSTKGKSISKNENILYQKLKEKFHLLESQFALNDEKRSYIYDIRLGDKIIEYNGDFWHANPKVFNESFVNPYNKLTLEKIHEKDLRKIKVAENQNYKILIIWEKDFNENQEKVITECINFLIQ